MKALEPLALLRGLVGGRRVTRRDSDERGALAPAGGARCLAARRVGRRGALRGGARSSSSLARADAAIAAPLRSTAGKVGRPAACLRDPRGGVDRNGEGGSSSATLAIWPASTSQPTVSSRIRSSFSSAAMGRAMPVALVAAQLSTVRLRLGAATKRCGSRPITAGIDSRQMLVLPNGLHFGRVDTQSAPLVVARALAGRIDLEHYRGRTCYATNVQPPSEWYERLATWSPPDLRSCRLESTVRGAISGLERVGIRGAGRRDRRSECAGQLRRAARTVKALSARIL